MPGDEAIKTQKQIAILLPPLGVILQVGIGVHFSRENVFESLPVNYPSFTQGRQNDTKGLGSRKSTHLRGNQCNPSPKENCNEVQQA
jgi:hypothetical protein